MRVALAGNPNSGKSTLFNLLTGLRVKVANYPGVTVESRSGKTSLPSKKSIEWIDLPGCYSLTARSSDEEIAHRLLLGDLGDQKPDVVVCVVDSTNLNRGFYLVEQLLEMNICVVVALNMIDLAEKKKIIIDQKLLSKRFSCPVVATSGYKKTGINDLLKLIENIKTNEVTLNIRSYFDDMIFSFISQIETILNTNNIPTSIGKSLWLLTSREQEIIKTNISPDILKQIIELRKTLPSDRENSFNRKIITQRYEFIDENLKDVVQYKNIQHNNITKTIDKVLLHPFWGLSLFVLIMALFFQAIFTWSDPMIGSVEALMGFISDTFKTFIPEGYTRSLLVNGVIAGIGNILVFLPQIVLLFLGLSILEESGYMARATFLLDNIMCKVGLHGKAFIPLMSSFACAIPGVIACRTVESSRDRLITILVAPFMSCSARLPVYVLVITAIFSTTKPLWGVFSIGGLAITAMYFLGFFVAIGTTFLLKKTILKSKTPTFLIELPPYRVPRLKTILYEVYIRAKIFITQTGTIILALSILLWGLLTFPQKGIDENVYKKREQTIKNSSQTFEQKTKALNNLNLENQSILLKNSFGGQMGVFIEPLIKPLGFDWHIGIGLIASFAAREVLVSTLGQVYNLDSDIQANSPALRDALLSDIDPNTQKPRFTPLVGISLMVFFVLAMQCLSTVATVKRETNTWKWPIIQLLYMNLLAYLASFIVYQGGKIMGWG